MQLKIFIIASVLIQSVKLTLATNMTQGTYKKMLLGRNYWPTVVYKTVTSPTKNQIECLSQCMADSSNCNICIYNGTCWLAKIGLNNALVTTPQQDMYSFVDFGFLMNQFSSNIIQVSASLINSTWAENFYTTTTLNNVDAYWDCLNQCLNVRAGTCSYFVFNSTSEICYLLIRTNFNSAQITDKSATMSVNYATVQQSSLSVPSVDPTLWPSKLYLQLKGITFQQCASLCWTPGFPACHYFVYVASVCYLGNAFIQQSILGTRTDAQTTVMLTGTSFFAIGAGGNAYTNYITRTSAAATNANLCSIYCFFGGDCHFYIYSSSYGCLIGNFKKKPMANGFTGAFTAYIFKDLVRIDNVPDNNYFNTTMLNTVWSPKIIDSYGNLLSEGLCSSICTLIYPRCQLFVYVMTNQACFIGQLAASGTYSITGTSDIVRTRKLYQVFTVVSSGRFQSSCPTGFNLISCGSSNPSGPERYRSTFPVSATTCECYDGYGIRCEAWCTTMPVSSFQITTTSGGSYLNANCPAGTYLIGCNVNSYTRGDGNYEYWISFRPVSSQSCECFNYWGTYCHATCASNVNNYEIVSAYSSGSISVSCNNPNNTVLGCGVYPYRGGNWDMYRIARVTSNSTCTCWDGYGATCYAICGQLY